MKPRVSVIVPTRDRRAMLPRALESVAAQGFRDYELIVVDDASTDGTAAWLRTQRPAAQLIEMNPSEGAAAARNRGLEQARGELIAFLDDDDVWRSGYLEAQVANLDAHPTAALSFAGHWERDLSGRERRPDTGGLMDYPSPLIRLTAESFIHTLSVVVCRADAFVRFGRFDEGLKIVHDLDWYARVLAGGGNLVPLALPLVERTVPGGLLGSHRLWFREERDTHERLFAAHPEHASRSDRVYAYRSLFFAQVGLGRGDLAFGLTRLAEAFAISTHWTLRIAWRRLLRRIALGRVTAWHAAVGELR